MNKTTNFTDIKLPSLFDLNLLSQISIAEVDHAKFHILEKYIQYSPTKFESDPSFSGSPSQENLEEPITVSIKVDEEVCLCSPSIKLLNTTFRAMKKL